MEPYPVWQARTLGAGAVLLIVRALDDMRLVGLIEVAAEACLDALVEVHDAAELKRALVVDAAGGRRHPLRAAARNRSA